jgi:hypothetical protein
MPSYTKPRVPGDVFMGLHEEPMYHFDTKEVTNGTADDMVLPPGYPMDDNVPVLLAGIAGIDGLNYRHTVIAAGETARVLVYVRGMGSINGDALPTVDYAGDAFNMDNLRTQILDIPDTIIRREPTVTATVEMDG